MTMSEEDDGDDDAAVYAACGGLLIAGDHVNEFYSHAKYGDMNYDNRADCGWLLAARDHQHRVRLRFQTFEIEAETECGSVLHTRILNLKHSQCVE